METGLTTGNTIAIVAVVVTAGGLLLRELRLQFHERRAKAERIRQAAGLLIAKMQRRGDLSRSLYDRLQIAAVLSDSMAVRGDNIVDVRDSFWSYCWHYRTEVDHLISEEKIELSFAEIYGYDQRIYDTIAAATSKLEELSTDSFRNLLEVTQHEIVVGGQGLLSSSELGNRLRLAMDDVRDRQARAEGEVVGILSGELLNLVKAEDRALTRKTVEIVSRRVLITAVSYDRLEVDESETDGLDAMLCHPAIAEPVRRAPDGRPLAMGYRPPQGG